MTGDYDMMIGRFCLGGAEIKIPRRYMFAIVWNVATLIRDLLVLVPGLHVVMKFFFIVVYAVYIV